LAAGRSARIRDAFLTHRFGARGAAGVPIWFAHAAIPLTAAPAYRGFRYSGPVCTILASASPAMGGRRLKVLIIDENLVRTAILEDGLRDCGELDIHHIREMDDLLARVAAINPDVILIDLENPSRDTLEQMFQVSRWAERPIAMFVDKSDSDSVQAAIDAGVSAYVVDGLKRERVKPVLDVTISRFHAFHRLQSELNEARSALEDRKLVERAKQILMEQTGMNESAAYSLLRRKAMDQSRKIVDIARALVTAADLLRPGGDS